jgi:hypothetical protein
MVANTFYFTVDIDLMSHSGLLGYLEGLLGYLEPRKERLRRKYTIIGVLIIPIHQLVLARAVGK